MKKVIRLKEQDLQNIIRESVNRILKENNYVDNVYKGKPNTLHKNLTQMNENYVMARNIVKQILTKMFGSIENIDITLGELINTMENNGYLLKYQPEETINHECYIFSDQNNELDINCIVYNPTLNPQEQIHIESFDIEPNY